MIVIFLSVQSIVDQVNQDIKLLCFLWKVYKKSQNIDQRRKSRRIWHSKPLWLERWVQTRSSSLKWESFQLTNKAILSMWTKDTQLKLTDDLDSWSTLKKNLNRNVLNGRQRVRCFFMTKHTMEADYFESTYITSTREQQIKPLLTHQDLRLLLLDNSKVFNQTLNIQKQGSKSQPNLTMKRLSLSLISWLRLS